MTKNRIKELPPLGALKNLETFVVSENLIEKLPRDIGECKGLTFLDVSQNQLLELPNQLCSCRKVSLRKFWKLADVSLFSQLTRLAAMDNKLKTLPFDFDYLENLCTLRLR